MVRAGETSSQLIHELFAVAFFTEETLHYVNWNSPTALVPRSCELVILQVRGDRFLPSPPLPRHSYVINSFYRCCVICLASLLPFLCNVYTLFIFLFLFYTTWSWVLNYEWGFTYITLKIRKTDHSKIFCWIEIWLKRHRDFVFAWKGIVERKKCHFSFT